MDLYKSLIVDRQQRREAIIDNADEDLITSDDDMFSYTANPIYAKMVPDLHTYIGFPENKFAMLYSLVENELQKKGRGRNRKISPQDSFCLFLHYLRCYPPIEQMGIAFGIKPATLQFLLHDVLRIVEPIFRNHFINNLKNGVLPQYEAFPNAPLIVDATVHQIGRPSGTFQNSKEFYSPKHSLYCLKTQVIINRKGLALFVQSGIPGSVHDFRLFKNTAAEIVLFIQSKGLNSMEILADKGYIGTVEYPEIVLITPHKTPKGSMLAPDQSAFNKKLAKIRVQIENYFGRLKNKFDIMSLLFRGDASNLHLFVNVCCALTNFDIDVSGNSLNGQDGSYFRRTIAADVAKAREEEQKAKEKAKKRVATRRALIQSSLTQTQ